MSNAAILSKRRCLLVDCREKSREDNENVCLGTEDVDTVDEHINRTALVLKIERQPNLSSDDMNASAEPR